MEIDGKEVIFKGAGCCHECGKLFEGDPMETFNRMKDHERMTGHEVWDF